MKIILLLSFLLFFLGALSAKFKPRQLVRDLFNTFKLTYSKTYKTSDEEEKRFNIFVNNYVKIQKYNQEKTGVILALNQFADLTLEEYNKTYTGFFDKFNDLAKKVDLQLNDLPPSLDWRVKGAVTPVKDQGACGSSAYFSAIGALEGLYFVQKGELLTFSEQYCMDCVAQDWGCMSAYMPNCFQYVARNGILLDSDFPYIASKRSRCTVDSSKLIIKVNTGYAKVPVRSANALKAALQLGPVSIALDASSFMFQFYKSGVITSGYGVFPNQGALAVGYGTIDGVEAFIVKNSWGTGWGNDGYVYIGMDESQNVGYGVCGIFKWASFPVTF